MLILTTFVLAISLFLSSILPTSTAQQVRTRVVDDSDPAISYTVGTSDGQLGQWAAVDATTQDASCAAVNCRNALDANQVHGGTWHEGYGSVAISYTFNGTGIAAYFISSDQSDAPATTSFFIDGQLSQTVRGASPLSYNMQVFAVSDLQDQSHELFISQSGSESSTLILDYLTYEESVTNAANSNDLTSATSAGVQGPTEPVDPLRVPASHGTERSAAGGAVAGALIGTLLLLVAVGVFLKLRNRTKPALLPLNYDVGDEARPEVVASRRPPPLNISHPGEPQRKQHHIASHYNESTTDEKSDESSVAQPSQNDRRSRFRSAVSTVVGALSPCQITSFSRLELRTALAALIHSGHQQQPGTQHGTPADTLNAAPSFTHLAVPVTSRPASPKSSITPLGSITSSPSFRSVSSISSAHRPPSVPPTAPLRLPRSSDQCSPPYLPRFTFEERRRRDTTTDPEVLQRQIQALLWNAPPLPSRAPTPSAPPPYASRPPTLRVSLSSRRTTASLPVGLHGNPPPLPPLPPFPEKVATRI